MNLPGSGNPDNQSQVFLGVGNLTTSLRCFFDTCAVKLQHGHCEKCLLTLMESVCLITSYGAANSAIFMLKIVVIQNRFSFKVCNSGAAAYVGPKVMERVWLSVLMTCQSHCVLKPR